MPGADANELSIVTVGNNVSLMTAVDANESSIVTVGNNVSLMTGVEVHSVLLQSSMIHYYQQ
jgi:acetyltransferase-like isoleucine patch superfamily enzyme